MQRYLENHIRDDLQDKIVLVSGPRQVGKTTLSKMIFPAGYEYLNFDYGDDRLKISEKSWRREGMDVVIFDELHKMKKWKQWIKGVFDKEGTKPRLLVTGSARLDLLRKGGDSLSGRFFHYTLHPLSPAEVKNQISDKDGLERFLLNGPFPEPFLKANERFSKRWRKSHIDRTIREDLLDLEKVREIKLIEVLVELLSRQVGVPVSYNSLARELQVSPHTVVHWVEILEKLCVVFKVTPYSGNIARAIRKEPKIYLYDTSAVHKEAGAKIENLVACSLLKRIQFLEDISGDSYALHYIRDHQKREVDFLVVHERRKEFLIEVKLSDAKPAGSLCHYSVQLKPGQSLQLVMNLDSKNQERDYPLVNGFIKIRNLYRWLKELEA